MYSVKKKILLTGASGMFGENFAELCAEKYDILGLGRTINENPKLKNYQIVDIVDKNKVTEVYKTFNPDIVIHAAAVTDVDWCEKNPDETEAIHIGATKYLVELAKLNNALFIYLSTDMVYSSEGHDRANEQCQTTLTNVYAKTKFLGEQIVLSYENSLSFRVSIFGYRKKGKQSFGEWVLEGLRKQKELTMFKDVYFTPISTFDLVEVINFCIDKNAKGLFNVGSSNVISKYEFAKIIANKLGVSESCLKPISSKEKMLNAKRPTNLSMDISKIEQVLNLKMPTAEVTIEKWLRLEKRS